jgi:hypothetical protein
MSDSDFGDDCCDPSSTRILDCLRKQAFFNCPTLNDPECHGRILRDLPFQQLHWSLFRIVLLIGAKGHLFFAVWAKLRRAMKAHACA